MVGEFYHQINRLPVFFWIALFAFTAIGSKVLPHLIAKDIPGAISSLFPTI